MKAIVSGTWMEHIGSDDLTVDELLENLKTMYDLAS